MGPGFRLHGIGRHSVKTESRHLASHLSLQIGFLVLLRSLDLLLRSFLEPPCPGPWFGWNTSDEAQRDDHACSYLKSFPTSNYTWYKGLYPHNYANLLLEAVLPPSEEPRNLFS